MVDARKPLPVLQDEWSSCLACELGQRRQMVSGAFVAGQGAPGGIMFIGEAPSRLDEELGIPFSIDPDPNKLTPGQLFRAALDKLGFTHFYLSNLVTCRACETIIDPETNTPKIRKGKYGRPDEIIYRDSVPKPQEIEACLPRLHEEIYIVDPVLIVTLGATAAEKLLNRNVSITMERGRTEAISIPGATMRAMHTEKRQVWGRKVQGEMRFPTEQNMVRYLVLPTLHPAYVLRKLGDRGANSPLRQFGDDLRLAVKIYEWHMVHVLGRDPATMSNADLSNLGAYDESEGEEGT